MTPKFYQRLKLPTDYWSRTYVLSDCTAKQHVRVLLVFSTLLATRVLVFTALLVDSPSPPLVTGADTDG